MSKSKPLPLPEDEILRLAAAIRGKRGGQSTSEAKIQASRENAKKGGRPKGSKNKPK